MDRATGRRRRPHSHGGGQGSANHYGRGLRGDGGILQRQQSGTSHIPPIPPGEFLTAKAVSGAVIYAAIGKDPKTAPDRFQSFVQQGIEVTAKIKLWEKT
jgi:hypothetical protein